MIYQKIKLNPDYSFKEFKEYYNNKLVIHEKYDSLGFLRYKIEYDSLGVLKNKNKYGDKTMYKYKETLLVKETSFKLTKIINNNGGYDSVKKSILNNNGWCYNEFHSFDGTNDFISFCCMDDGGWTITTNTLKPSYISLHLDLEIDKMIFKNNLSYSLFYKTLKYDSKGRKVYFEDYLGNFLEIKYVKNKWLLINESFKNEYFKIIAYNNLEIIL